MLPQLLPVFGGAAVGLIAGGSLRGLSRPIAWWPLGLASIVFQLMLARISIADQPWLGSHGHWLWAAALGATLVVLLRNCQLAAGARRLPWQVAALGVGLNLLVIVANGGYMPVSQAALEQTGQSAELAARTGFRRDVPLDGNTRLWWLADILTDPTWLPRPTVASIGDRLLGLGLAGWAFASVAGARRSYAARVSAFVDATALSASHRSRALADTGLLAK